ncbi:fibronectin-binding autotransporter adhesin [Mesorhizobium soli]|uniref:autotransporter domain-containing protein n=1 Tax=Pseudaminobacter soli (ex Li et al. 2025) TaxID=1295366 RepID=UPI002476AFA3|nr:autotransporter domain-containing protein [Mesorhizobium soli]MDH6233181.1 fibronectin-binding autotransporter adhesin [Mesorhizobium soli]
MKSDLTSAISVQCLCGRGGRSRRGWVRLLYPTSALKGRLLGTTSIVTLGLALSASPSFATDWTGTQSSDWFTAGNWTNGIPDSNVDATIVTDVNNAVVVDKAGAYAHKVNVGGTGTLTIQNGGAVSSVDGIIGIGLDSTSTVTVDGAGSSWTNSGNLFLGMMGDGTLTIQNGGAVSSVDGLIGMTPLSTGIVTVDGKDSSWTNSGDLHVGIGGTGTLTIRNRGAISNATGYIGSIGSAGAVTVDGTDSSWTNSGDLYVGFGGTGTLTIQDGGAVSNDRGSIYSSTVTVDGVGSSWTNSGDLGVSYGGRLTIQNGGKVSSGDGAYGPISFSGVINGGTVTVDGAGSAWTNSNDLFVGWSDAGTLTIQNGGKVSNGSGYIGYLPVSTGSTVTVDGKDSSWSNSGDLNVGFFGTGTLKIENGGTVEADSIVVNAGSLLTGNGTVAVTSGNTVTIKNGGALTPANGTLVVDGNLTLDAGATATIGATAQLTVGGILSQASGSTLNVIVGSNEPIITADNATLDGTLNIAGYSGPTTPPASTNGLPATQFTVIQTSTNGITLGSDFSVSVGGSTSPVDYLTVITGKSADSDSYNVGLGLTWLDTTGNSNGVFTLTNANEAFDVALALTDQAANATTGWDGKSLTKNGDGTLTLSAQNTYTGTTTVNAGTLAIASTGGITSDVTNTATFENAGTVTGSVTNNTGATFTQTAGSVSGGVINYGTVNANGGALNGAISNNVGGSFNVGGGVTSDGTFDNAAGATLTIGESGNYTLAGLLTNEGSVAVDTGGSLTTAGGIIGNAAGSTGAATVAGTNATWVNSGDLHVGSAGIGTLTIQDRGTVSNTTGIIGLSTGSTGAVTVTGEGSSWISSGALLVGGFGTGTLMVQNGGKVSSGASWIGFSDVATGTVTVTGKDSSWANSGFLSVGEVGTGTLTIEDGGAVSTLSGYVGQFAGSTGTVIVTGKDSTWTTSGYLDVGDAGNGTLAIQNGGAVNGGGSVTIAKLSGSTGTLNIGGASGQAAVAAGTLNAASVMFGAGAGKIVFNHTASNYFFAPAISGAGTVTVDAGTTILTGDSGGFTGTTTVKGGTLAVNGTLGGALDVLAAGRLQGTGTVSNTTVSGAIAPGNSIGTLNVAGNITFNAGSTYEVEVNAADQFDRIAATGKATIDGGTVQVLNAPGAYALGSHYAIVTAASGLTGTFASMTQAVPLSTPFLSFGLSYDAHAAYLNVERSGLTFASVGETTNQIATGGGLDSAPLTSPLVAAMAQLDVSSARSNFDQLSGEVHASAKTALIEDSRFVRDAAIDRLRAAFDAVGAMETPAMSYASGGPEYAPAATERFALWGRAFGSWGHTDGDDNAARFNRSTGGFFAGGDGPVFDTWRLGLLAGYSRNDFDVRDRHSSGTSDNYHLGLYGGTEWSNLAFRGGAAYTWHDISTGRSIAFPGFADNLEASYHAGTAQVFGELAYGVRASNVGFEPFANLAYVSLHTDGFTEKGGAAALLGSSGTTDATFSTFGLRASTTFDLGGTSATARGGLGWKHAFGDVTPLAAMAFAGGAPFTIAGAPIKRDAAVVEAGLDFAIAPNATLGISYNGQFASGLSDQSVRADFNWKF